MIFEFWDGYRRYLIFDEKTFFGQHFCPKVFGIYFLKSYLHKKTNHICRYLSIRKFEDCSDFLYCYVIL